MQPRGLDPPAEAVMGGSCLRLARVLTELQGSISPPPPVSWVPSALALRVLGRVAATTALLEHAQVWLAVRRVFQECRERER